MSPARRRGRGQTGRSTGPIAASAPWSSMVACTGPATATATSSWMSPALSGERERKREAERVCVCVSVSVCQRVRLCLRWPQHHGGLWRDRSGDRNSNIVMDEPGTVWCVRFCVCSCVCAVFVCLLRPPHHGGLWRNTGRATATAASSCCVCKHVRLDSDVMLLFQLVCVLPCEQSFARRIS
jgi:hypothetical protein